MTNSEEILNKLNKYDIKSFAIKHQVSRNSDPKQDLSNPSGGTYLIYTIEFEVSKPKPFNVIINFKFSPISSNTDHLVKIISATAIPPRPYGDYFEIPGDYELWEDNHFSRDLNKFTQTYNSYMKDEKTASLIPDNKQKEIAESLRVLSVYSDKIQSSDPLREVKILDVIDSNFELSEDIYSSYLSNTYRLMNIIYLALQYKSQDKELLNKLEPELKNFDWKNFYKNNLSLSKNLAYDVLRKCESPNLITTCFEVSSNRKRGGEGNIFNRTRLILSFFLLLKNIDEFSSTDYKNIDSLSKNWKLKRNLTLIFENYQANYSNQSNTDTIRAIEKIFQLIFDSHKKRFFTEDLKTNVEDKDLKKNFRFSERNLRVFFSLAKNRNFIVTNSKNTYEITTSGIEYLKEPFTSPYERAVKS